MVEKKGVEKEFIDSLIRNGGWLSVCRVTSFLQISCSLRAAKCWDQRVPSLCFGMNITSPRHPVIFSDNAWGVQSPSLRFNYSRFSGGDLIPRVVGGWATHQSNWIMKTLVFLGENTQTFWNHHHFFYIFCGESLKKPFKLPLGGKR